MKTKKITQILLFVILFLPFLKLQAQDEDVMFQAFDWNVQNQPAGQTWYNVVSQVTNSINDAGIDVIWMPPPSNSAAPQGYLPRELYNFNSAYGTESQLRAVIGQYHSLGIKVLSDIVINHRVGSNDAVTFTNPAWPTYFITADDEGRNFVNFPVEFSINGDYVPGRSLKSDGSNGTYGPARDLDHKNPEVRNEIIKWMRFLKNDLGFDGWRYDFVHGYDPIYNKEYNDATGSYFSVGELLESSRVQINNFVNATQQSSSAFDFNTKVSLQNALRDNNLSYLRDFQGRPSGFMGINPSKAVTFLDNHDTGFAQQCCGSNYVFPGGEINLRKGYAYILTHPGNPMVFWTHFFNEGAGVKKAIKDLIATRKSVRVHAGSPINIAEARNNLYAAYVDGKSGTLAMKLGSGNWFPDGAGWTLKTSGTDYAVWTKGENTQPVTSVQPYTVNFFKPTSWGNTLNAYFYNDATNSTLAGTSRWPGQRMTRIAGTDWFSFAITPPAGVPAENIKIIFNDGVNQSTNLSRSITGWYRNGSWSNECPIDCSGTESKTVTLNFKKPSNTWGNTTNVYLYDKKTNKTLSGTSAWPGTRMDNIAGTLWLKETFTIPNTTSATDIGVVFNNNRSQTVNLTRGTNGWFTITGYNDGKGTGVWSNTCTSGCPDQSSRILKSARNVSLFSKSFVSPNPIKQNSILNLTTYENGILEVMATTILGQTKIIYSNPSIAGSQYISLSADDIGQAGIYFLTIRLDGKELDQLKVIKQ